MNLKLYIHPRNLYLLSMMCIGVGIGCSNILMSWGAIGLVLAFLWGGNYRIKLNMILQDKRILALSSIYLLFVLGLIHTSNFSYALHDLKIKLPLLIIPPFVFAFFPLSKKEFKIIFHSMFLGGCITMLAGAFMFVGILDLKMVDMRSYSPFIAHLRVGTLLVLCIFLCIYFLLNKEFRFLPGWCYILFAISSFGFLLLLQSLTGLVAFAGCILIATIYGLSRRSTWKLSFILLIACLLTGTAITALINREYNRIHNIEKVDLHNLPKATIHGAIYRHDTTRKETINGHYIWINICNFELHREWKKRSKLDYDGKTKKGWPVHGTLITYLASKGLKKNAEAVQSLTDKEVKAIEDGVVNYLNLNPLDIRYRINQLLVELDSYKRTGNPNQLSFATRLETWKVAVHAIKLSPLIGYGTGDVKDAMEIAYTETQSALLPENHLNPHQQYLTTALAIGLIGLLTMLSVIFYPVIRFRKQHILFIIPLTIAAISMLDEDTLETQAGCTQFIFLYVLTYMFQRSLEKKVEKG